MGFGPGRWVDAVSLQDLCGRVHLGESRERGQFARRADVTLREGGRYRCETLRLGLRDATIDRCEPGRRLRLIYHPDPRFPAAAAAVVDDLLFEPYESGTRLHVIGGGLPGEREWDRPLRLLRAGWQVALHDLEQYLHGPRHARATA